MISRRLAFQVLFRVTISVVLIRMEGSGLQIKRKSRLRLDSLLMDN
jgi:hypothetical protein